MRTKWVSFYLQIVNYRIFQKSNNQMIWRTLSRPSKYLILNVFNFEVVLIIFYDKKQLPVLLILWRALLWNVVANVIWFIWTVAFVYSFESIGILLSFSNQSHGLIFSLVELIGAFSNFAQIPIVGAVQKSILMLV